MKGMRRLGRERIAVAVVLAATLSGGGAAVADDAGTERPELGRIAYTDGELSLDGAGDADARVITIDDAHLADGPAPGWDTTAIPEGTAAGESVRWSLSGVDGPGDLRVYAEADRDGGEEALLFDSADGLPDVYELPVGETGATRWVFTAEGTYQVIFTAEATTPDGRSLFTGTAYTVLVGDEAIARAAEAAEAEGTGMGGTPSGEAEETGDEAAPGSGDGGAGSVGGQASPLTAAAGSAATATSPATSSAAAASDVVSTTKVLDEGHIDFAARAVDGKLQIHIKDGTVSGRTTWREPSSVILHVKPAAKNTLPDGDEFAFLGKGGAPVWLLDQVQQEGLLWPGWSTDNITAGATEGGVKFSLSRVAGPGTYALYTYDAMSGANVLFNSKDGVPDSFDVAANTHAHGGWAFTEEGTYRLTFTMSGKLADGTAVSDTETVTFVVGDQDPGAVKPGDGSGGGATSGADGGTSESGSGEETGTGAATGTGSGDDQPKSDDDGSMASTGAGNPALLGGTAAALAALGTAAVVITRRRSRTAGRNTA
ncbi:TIGR03773 family transporter-associated surface protein [Streptomyces sp. NPDC058335]|uniref:TIGR03773 family transporter-associated surface protein n=1 Tax=Streptomyces sp. NPDC058335 TaxID=3346451 RepID=UPI00365C4849